jgi:hypothetical protein
VIAYGPFGRFHNDFGAIALQVGPRWRRQAGVVGLAGRYVVEDEGSSGRTSASRFDGDFYRIAWVYLERRSTDHIGCGRKKQQIDRNAAAFHSSYR